MSLFDRTFWRMLFGFVLILTLGLAAVYAFGFLSGASDVSTSGSHSSAAVVSSTSAN